MHKIRKSHFRWWNRRPSRRCHDGFSFMVTDCKYFHVHRYSSRMIQKKTRKFLFPDVMIERKDFILETSVYRKERNNNIYMNRNSYSPHSWKIGTLQNLTGRAITTFSLEIYMEKEVDHLRRVFCDINDYTQERSSPVEGHLQCVWCRIHKHPLLNHGVKSSKHATNIAWNKIKLCVVITTSQVIVFVVT